MNFAQNTCSLVCCLSCHLPESFASRKARLEKPRKRGAPSVEVQTPEQHRRSPIKHRGQFPGP